MVESKPENILSHLRQTLIKGKNGVDYTVIPRDKNKELRENFFIDDSRTKEILLSLTAEDYICSEESDNEDFPDDIVHIFIKTEKLIQRFADSFVDVNLYIKFTWPRQNNKKLLIISFHEENKEY
ncbi:MAG: hypothetical protein E7279_11430 [Lachnospiraceae bacterium]|nr:hypothetical protein [Lachnospiraceae bacterium]